ncbi:MAG: ferritin family protein [Deltaproteobacteria bacterium]|jgi:rubrerythrin|nr:ferritin family protein [Deltaproteobacteria bacterium]MCW8893608.1 ferritin family protein [Deltaproteobacteria bacterium]MCW9049958.1 ferritin family protein [Deltaproteobacteria bacterium]
MPQEYIHQEAIRVAIESEKQLMCFYQKAADMVADDGGKQVFGRLAEEKKTHVGTFFRYYRGEEFGSFEDFISTPCSAESEVLKELRSILDDRVKERRAREIAMRKEEQFEKILRSQAKQIVDPGVRTVFDQMAQESRNHYAVIESEYARFMRMPHETDIDTFVRE